VRGSYVSCQSALAHYALIPEHVPATTSVTTARPARWDTPLGVYEFRHVKTDLFRGYRLIEPSPGQRAFITSPEKALLDLVHLQPGGDAPGYLQELRLQNLDRLDQDELQRQANLAHSPKLRRAAAFVAALARSEPLEYETLRRSMRAIRAELAAEGVRIHPFVDGNGRTARALATLILYKCGFDTKRFFALEEYYNVDHQCVTRHSPARPGRPGRQRAAGKTGRGARHLLRLARG